ncbi:BTB/POZ protein [Rhizophagus clarus]|uniref:BTB/POZ protein n=1 Tax=Rhizophagus clarus TaxID=94130 RepID=A0A8H3QYR2_9GLOM|nr:BTB/POZ protein [Rhizophagus clarus]
MDYRFLQILSQNLIEILDDDEYYDITIEVGNDPYKNDEILVQIKLPNISPDIFQIILRYIYGGKLSLEDYDNLDIVKILVAANELNLQELVTYVQSFLIKNKADWMKQNFNLIYQTSFDNNSFLELQKYCTDLMSKYPDKILKSMDFASIPEKNLISLIQSDNLQMSVIQVWENVLKWGLAQNPAICSDPSNYSKDDVNSLKNTLQRCIPFIRFYDLTSKEFSDYILPYREILPENLYMDLLKTFLNLHPNSKPSHKTNPQISKEINSPPPLPVTDESELNGEILEEIQIKLKLFHDMGFTNKEEILKAIKESNGDMMSVFDYLMGASPLSPSEPYSRSDSHVRRKSALPYNLSQDSDEDKPWIENAQSSLPINISTTASQLVTDESEISGAVNYLDNYDRRSSSLPYISSQDSDEDEPLFLVNSQSSSPINISTVTSQLVTDESELISEAYQQMLTYLRDMGFCNYKENLEAIKKFNGDLDKVIEYLLL